MKLLFTSNFSFYKQFLLFPQCFQKASTADTSKQGLNWERVNHFLNKYSFCHNEKKLYENIVEKVNLLKMNNFTCFAIGIMKFFNSHVSVVVCSFFEFGTVSKLSIREWVNDPVKEAIGKGFRKSTNC